MTSHRVPVLVSRYADEVFVAHVIDGPEASAGGATASESFEQIKSHLRKQGEREPGQYWPKIEEYELRTTSVTVRLFYRDGKRRFPASREMKIPVRYVLGHYVDKSVECFLVDFDIVFHCPALRELPQLIDEAIRGAAARVTSRQMIATTPPAESELRYVRVRLKEGGVQRENDAPGALSMVADPIIKRKRKHKNKLALHRDEEIALLTEAMRSASVLLIGESGCGKTTIARTAAYHHETIARELARVNGAPPPSPLVWASSAENLIAGMQYLGEWEERLEAVIADLESIGGSLLISSLVDLIRLGGTQPTDSLAAFLMPYVRRGEVRLIVETTPEELEAARRLLPGWVECFQLINIEPLTTTQTRNIVETILSDAGRNHRLEVEPTTAETATRLFAQFMPYQPPPRGIVQMANDVIQDKRRHSRPIQSTNQDANHRGSITPGDIVEKFTRLTGLPDQLLRDSITIESDDVQKHFSEQVIGQPKAVEAAVNVVLRMKAGLCDPRRPVSTMMFCGPTGVGKTQLARSLADYLFGESESREKSIIRLDMSEYANWDAVNRFLMAPDGEVANWIARLRARPMSVVLLDEFEKSSPEVHDCLLSAMDEGRLTDRFGRTTTLCGSVIVLTSNVGSRSSSAVGFNGQDNRATMRAIEQEFRPEFLNRLDEIVQFDPLSKDIIKSIVRKELQELSQRETLRMRRVSLKWDESVVDRLAQVGFDPLLGARPLQRAIEREVVAQIARRLLATEKQTRSIAIDLAELVSDEVATR